MSDTVAAMRCKFGSTEYYVVSMKASDLVGKARIPSEIPGWNDMTLQEREQRDINFNRVKKQIVPYIAHDEDRFFGAIILMVEGLEKARFVSMENFARVADDFTKAVLEDRESESKTIGFLTLPKGKVMTPLDGQHRLVAIRFALDGMDQNKRPIVGIKPCKELAGDDVTVMLVPYDKKRARKIFTKVNKYAKATTTGQNLVTDDDDIIAVLSRMIANDSTVIGARLVKYKSNTLSDKDRYFTTLATLAECNRAILEAVYPKKIDPTRLPVREEQKLYENEILDVWKFLVKRINLFSVSLKDKSEGGDAKRKEIRASYLLGKPVAQVCLVKSFVRLTAPETKLSPVVAAKKLNAINWKKDAREWDRLLMSGGRMQTKNKNLATDIICYCAGQKLDKEKEAELLEKYRSLFPPEQQKKKQLPSLIK